MPPVIKILVLVISTFLVFAALFSRNHVTVVPQRKVFVSESVEPPVADGEIVLHYHERKPYYGTIGGKVTGLCADRAAKAFALAGLPYQWHETPAKRQLDHIRANHCRACAVGWFKTAKREAFGQFTRDIYQDKRAVAVARADNVRLVSGSPLDKTLSQRGLVLLLKDGYSYGSYVDDSIKANNPRLEVTTAGNLSMLHMIRSHRADYFFIGEEEAETVLSISGLPAQDFKFIHFTDMPAGNKRYILCSRKVEKQTLARLNRALDSIVPGAPGQGN